MIHSVTCTTNRVGFRSKTVGFVWYIRRWLRGEKGVCYGWIRVGRITLNWTAERATA